MNTEQLIKKLEQDREQWRKTAFYRSLTNRSKQAGSFEIGVLRKLKFRTPLSEEVIKEREGEE